MYDIDDVGVFLGLDVGKSAHHGHGLTTAGKKVFDKQLILVVNSNCHATRRSWSLARWQ
ncbi:hypothetical protein [Streptomyces vastus]|uniref:hypothetical protein n=1 Tax=Streptomyces vastus TaxID=285451 RepID=UPI0031DA132D